MIGGDSEWDYKNKYEQNKTKVVNSFTFPPITVTELHTHFGEKVVGLHVGS